MPGPTRRTQPWPVHRERIVAASTRVTARACTASPMRITSPAVLKTFSRCRREVDSPGSIPMTAIPQGDIHDLERARDRRLRRRPVRAPESDRLAGDRGVQSGGRPLPANGQVGAFSEVLHSRAGGCPPDPPLRRMRREPPWSAKRWPPLGEVFQDRVGEVWIIESIAMHGQRAVGGGDIRSVPEYCGCPPGLRGNPRGNSGRLEACVALEGDPALVPVHSGGDGFRWTRWTASGGFGNGSIDMTMPRHRCPACGGPRQSAGARFLAS